MQVQFTRRPDNGTLAEFERPDGVRVRVSSYDRTDLVPHDAAHLIIERAFRLPHGFWGCVTAGALFATVDVVEGRTRHDHRARSAALIKEHAAELSLAERLVGTVLAALEDQGHALARDLQATYALARLVPPPAPDVVAGAALAQLTDLRQRWARLRTGETFTLDWPVPRPRHGRWAPLPPPPRPAPGRRRAQGRAIR